MNKIVQSFNPYIKTVAGFLFRSIPLSRRIYRNGLTIFLYHDVTDNPSKFARDFGLAVSSEMFQWQIAWINKNFKVIHPLALVGGKPLPENAALITFDDGFYGTFANGLEHLEKMSLPSIVFLNMHAITEQEPILSAIACYREKYSAGFKDFAAASGICGRFHLTCTPEMLDQMNAQFGCADMLAINEYQGRFADTQLLTRYSNSGLVIYGNHLYQHWNSAALNQIQFSEQYIKNKKALGMFENSSDFFAFPNGKPGTCFTKDNINQLVKLGAKKIFSGVGRINHSPSDYLLGRLTLSSRDSSENILWSRVFRAF